MSTARSTHPTADFDAFVALLGSRLNLPLDGAAPQDRLVIDLGLDSVALFELFVLLEDTADRELPLELVESLETLADAWHWHTTLSQQGDDVPSGSTDRARG